jgi:glutamate---cysteine ligase / carboxylate-amine ligase
MEGIEIRSIHKDSAQLFKEMLSVRDTLCQSAALLGIQLSGGGTHPFMRWQDTHTSPTSRAEYFTSKYGYLMNKWTVFSLQIHIGVPNGDQAISLIRKLTPYIPHLIAMSASSHFFEGVDTSYDSCRSHGFACAPIMGHLPENITKWTEYCTHVSTLKSHGLILDQNELK